MAPADLTENRLYGESPEHYTQVTLPSDNQAAGGLLTDAGYKFVCQPGLAAHEHIPHFLRPSGLAPVETPHCYSEFVSICDATAGLAPVERWTSLADLTRGRCAPGGLVIEAQETGGVVSGEFESLHHREHRMFLLHLLLEKPC